MYRAVNQAFGDGLQPVWYVAANTASRRVIEACGGALNEERGGSLFYWVPTS